MMVIFTLLLGGMTHVQAQTSKAAEKAEKKQERKEKKEELLFMESTPTPLRISAESTVYWHGREMTLINYRCL